MENIWDILGGIANSQLRIIFSARLTDMDDALLFEEEFCQIQELVGNIHCLCKEMSECMQTFRQTICDRKRAPRRR